MDGKFEHIDLRLVEPPFGSNLTDLIIDLDHLRKKKLYGTTKPHIFFQLKSIFHTLESIGSASIEGNRTTIAEFIEKKIEDRQTSDERIIEIQNMEKALAFIDKNIEKEKIDRAFVSELHKRVVDGLKKEGSRNPGDFRKINVQIKNSRHVTPDVVQVPFYMEELFAFINRDDPPKYDLLKTAIAHHRFVWIHPFDNGNGRAVRLITYAMLVKQGFNVHIGRIVNPTAVFCSDRNMYYKMLTGADAGTEAALLGWCEYVLGGLKGEIEKIDRLLDYAYLRERILLPTIQHSAKHKLCTDQEAQVLTVAAKRQEFKAADLKEIFPGKLSAEISRIIRNLINKKMILPVEPKARKYVLRFDNSYLLRGVIEMFDKNGFLPLPLNQ